MQNWFDDLKQKISGSTSNTVDENKRKWKNPPVLKSNLSSFVYPDIQDNTEGIAAFHDLVPFIPPTYIWLDVGGGSNNSNCQWMENKFPQVKM